MEQKTQNSIPKGVQDLARRPLEEDEIYLFTVKLCDNEIDRDGERFSLEALQKMEWLFLGKTGIFNHDPKGENQTARLYDVEVVTDENRTTTAGETYTWLKGYAYMMRTEQNKSLIQEIDGGIKKEVSIACRVKQRKCSICGAEEGSCRHIAGKMYDGKICHTILDEVTDAYEWSFVAVPAQREAGVTKQYSTGAMAKMQEVSDDCLEADEIRELIYGDILRLRYLIDGKTEQDAITKAAERMDLRELIAYRETLRTRHAKPVQSRLEPMENMSYRM